MVKEESERGEYGLSPGVWFIHRGKGEVKGHEKSPLTSPKRLFRGSPELREKPGMVWLLCGVGEQRLWGEVPSEVKISLKTWGWADYSIPKKPDQGDNFWHNRKKLQLKSFKYNGCTVNLSRVSSLGGQPRRVEELRWAILRFRAKMLMVEMERKAQMWGFGWLYPCGHGPEDLMTDWMYMKEMEELQSDLPVLILYE